VVLARRPPGPADADGAAHDRQRHDREVSS
jgi:hypothetical protein